ncbi:Uncharacterised protein [Mycoplasmopsis maculosa]|uniref:Integral membrane protein (Intg_mem_TP0381) n=1 Tax=Mycoplasmopsis maculosa TaxID=114885 RepID=A0A449B467_9BACT|nr:YwaF family protein [Mycoplasmopsis maculosa]VEU75338.1 Uncharacterised protein [Mycoplasmopsis maculosa]
MTKFFQSSFFAQELFKNIPGTLSFKDSWYSLVFYWVFFIFIFISSFLIYLYRVPIRLNYKRSKKIIGMSKKTFWMLVGWIIMFFIILRSIMIIFIEKYGVIDYKIDDLDGTVKSKLWEIIPLHFCRIMLLFISISLIINKIKFVKFYAYLAVWAAIVAVAIPGIYRHSGFDNWWYWDYLFAHGFIILFTVLLWNVSGVRFSFKDTLYTFAVSLAIGLVMFAINYASYKIAFAKFPNDPNERLKYISNYWYLGLDDYNEFAWIFGPLSKWPIHIVTWTILGYTLIILSIIISSFMSKFKVVRTKEGNFKLISVKSKYWKFYKASFRLKKVSKTNN